MQADVLLPQSMEGAYILIQSIFFTIADSRYSSAYSEVVSFRGTGKCCAGRCLTSAKYISRAFSNTIYISLKADGPDCCDPPRLHLFAERVSIIQADVLLPRSMEGARKHFLLCFTFKADRLFSLWIYLLIYKEGLILSHLFFYKFGNFS